jgi:hypothetical protein
MRTTNTTTPDATAAFLSRLGRDLLLASQRQQRKHRRLLVAVAALAGLALLAGGAFAATHGLWSGTDMTAAEVARQATTVTNDTWAECGKDGQCTTTTGSHSQVDILPSMGVTFVLPSGHTVSIVPAEPMLPDLPRGSDDGTLETATDASGKWIGGTWTVALRGGGRRTIAWSRADGSMTVTDEQNGKTTSNALHAGEVLPLVPGSLDPQALTREKAVTFDLPMGVPILIFPTFNKAYVEGPSMPGDPTPEPLPAGAAAKYGLTPVGEYNGTIPVSPNGGTWIVHLPDGTTRTISWRAGEAKVSITDRLEDGATQVTDVPIGHELPLEPFK